jgi:hypothetical protein
MLTVAAAAAAFGVVAALLEGASMGVTLGKNLPSNVGTCTA